MESQRFDHMKVENSRWSGIEVMGTDGSCSDGGEEANMTKSRLP